MANTKNTQPPADPDVHGLRLPRAWRPDQDDAPILRGKLVDLSIGTTMYGNYPIVVLDTGVERFAWHAMQQLAKAELIDANPEMGDDLEVTYGGKVKQQKDTGKNPYVAWSVVNHTRPKDVKGILARLGGQVPTPKPASVTAGGDFDEPSPF